MTNPAREALTRTVNRLIDEGEPVVTEITPIMAMPTLGVTESGGEIKMRRTLLPKKGLVPCEIVLCYLPHNTITPYVTWQRNTDEFESTYWGHYYRNTDEAVADFFARGGK